VNLDPFDQKVRKGGKGKFKGELFVLFMGKTAGVLVPRWGDTGEEGATSIKEERGGRFWVNVGN